ncbi:choice-of-anchor D domain-containing protein [Flavobacterium sp. MAH-1]|uniref:Choice-of-anchor D domain-containing protein n=1 Tax=Flavobacterium agri TaxID=2743471 RepID=A0A7Y8Y565_9FLAO|nr:choice-of-anchor D domain-containing protein [Flavobacterium agri]NUY82079.1 choice-of-anchor D domain-containing protein [Flavobacterium agri]NYA72103.1 choice-of-anchor D domain-containing protein [Flavobacterium agri]
MEKITQLDKKLIMMIFLALTSLQGFSQSQQFDTNGTFTVPAGVTSVTVQAWGAGGHGGNRTSSGRAGGGGGGAYASSVIAVTPGQSIPITVGQGSGDDNPGGDSWFLNASTVMAKGGNSGPNNGSTGGSGGSAISSVGATKYAGGNGAGTTASNSGGGGSSAASTAVGTNASGQTGGNAPGDGGDGGDGRGSGGNGTDGDAPGGGGGGAYKSGSSNRTGGDGGNGRVIVTYVIQDMNITGNSINIVSGDTTPSTADFTDFGSVFASSGTIVRNFSIQNTGTAALTGVTVSISGANASDFALTTSPTVSIAAAGNSTFTITFDPSALGSRTATVSVASNDPDENPYTFAIQGMGTLPVSMSVSGNATLITDGDTTPSTTDDTDFGTCDLTTGSIVKVFTVSNASFANTLSITGVTFSGTGSGDFSVTPTTASIAGGASANFTVTFNPTTAGVRNVTMNFANNDPDNNPYDFSIRATGADPDISVQGNSVTIADNDTTPSTTDGTNMGSVVVIGNTSISQTFYIHNLSGAGMPLTITSVTSSSSQFTISTAPASTVAVGASTPFVVTFDPTSTGTKTTTITITSNDANTSYVFSVSGVGTDPEIDVQGNSTSISDGDTTPSTGDWTNFGTTPLQAGFINRTFTISNSASATGPLNLGTITVTGTNPSDFTATQPAATTLAAGASTTFTVSFDPTASGTRTATINIPNNDSNESTYDFAVSGFGNDPEMEVLGNGVPILDATTATSVLDNTDFGSVSMQGGSAIANYTITNNGVGTMSIGAISFTGSGAAFFAVATAPPATLAQGASTTFQISFTPTSIGTKTATIYITNDDYDENPYNFNLTGLGVRTYPDTDNDGVADNVDIDDDNDGIIDTQEQSNCVQSVYSNTTEHTFLNETFGAGTTKGQININIPGATCTYCYEDGIVQANTTACPSQSSAILDDGEYVVTHRIANTTVGHPDNIHYDLAWNGLEDHTTGDTYGRMAVFNASYAPGVFYETTISGIMPNVPITYSFWALNIMSQSYYSGTIKPNITVEFLDTSNNVLSTYNTGDLGRCTGGVSDNTCAMSQWLQFTTSVNLGTVTSFIIRFRNNAPGGGGNDLAIDDITIKQQYCDRDGDGIANIFDLDADNDGLPDIEEAGFASLSGGRAKMDLTTAGVWVDANANGLHDTIDAMISGGTYVLPDTDGDGVRNFQDLDSDNDSLFDVDEAGLANGDGDVDGDALGDNADADLDGVLDIFDTFVGYGTQVRPFATNTDNIGNPDYMQLDSNNDGIRDIDTGLFASLDTNTDGKIDGTTDADKDGIMDTFDTAPNALGSPRNLERKLYIDFDGRNDYGEGSQVLSGLAQSTIMGWIKLAPGYNTEGIVFGQDNFYIRISATGIARAIAKTATLSYTAAPLAANRWYHVAAVYNGAASTEKLKLFINGEQVTQANTGSLAGTLNASTNKFTIAKYGVPGSATPMYFNGSIEEVRAFNTALTNDQLQKMVYQEIKQNGSAIRGEFVPKDVELTSWSSLLAYYRMDNFKDDVIDDHITTAIDAGAATTLARIYNVKNIRVQLAPMPFVTSQSSSIDTAVSQNNYVNGADVTTYPWSIVHVKHNLNLSANQTSLGMRIDPGLTVNINNNNKLENSWWLKLDGKLDLQGKSQLVQTANSDLDPTSSGYIEKDQQGTTNKFNYNYWSSPVGAINATTNNNNYTVNSVLKDGTNAASPVNLNWTTGYNSAATSPITLSSAWIYKFQNMSNAYANWAYVGQNGSLMAAQGFTLKGSSALTESQNYTFVGKPNNGVITLPIAPNMLNLTGNPYPSAMDADAFITDNLTVINGAIHFWEHFGTNNSHVTANYQGGYATYTLVGGTPPVAHPDGSGLGSSSKTPKRYIPVGQGFFVTATTTGGNITFRNSQRAFIKEDNTLSYSMFKTAVATSVVPTVQAPINADDIVPASQAYGKIRIGYDYANGMHRQLLIGFMNELATPGFDLGYDADNYDSNPDELVFLIGTHKAVIQGDGYFNVNSSYPLEVKAAATGNVKFKLDATENFDNDQPIYIYDKTTGIYHNLRDENFSLSLPAGTYSNRFFLRFVPEVSTTIQKDVVIEGIDAAYDIQSSELGIRNQLEDVTVYKATLVNMLGQVLEGYTVEGQDQTNIRIPVKSLSAGTYIVKIETTGGTMSQKVIIK